MTAQVLRELPKQTHENLLVGVETYDDAGVYRIAPDVALVQTVDFFPPPVDDPYTFGRIAAANSLSDVYAMGGRPVTALNIVGFPDQELPGEILVEILKGGAERVHHAGAVVVGGHGVRDAEIKFGLAVTGLIHPDRILTNAGARPGDVLILTKPVGSGTLTTAYKKGRISEGDLAQAVEVMIELNAAGCQAALEAGARAATDVTGFGLIGHAHELAEAGRVTLHIHAESVPLMDHARRLAREGVVTRACKATLDHLGARIEASDIDPALLTVLADAQTSGGLLLSVPQERVDQTLDLLKKLGASSQTAIGTVHPQSDRTVRLV